MTPESSLFRPGQPAPVESFVGRNAEIERLRGMVRASTRGRPGLGFVSGEWASAIAVPVLDDVNGPAVSSEFADWLKSTVYEIAASEQETRLCMLVVGLEARRQELVSRQPSRARVFELIDVAPWSDDEVTAFYRESFDRAGAGVSDAGLRNLTLRMESRRTAT